MSATIRSELLSALRGLRGLPCWHVSVGGATLPTFQLALGAKIARAVPLKNPNQPIEYRENDGEANLLVWCSWRLDDAEGPLTSYFDDEEAIVPGLNRLIGSTIRNAAASGPAMDLVITFSNGLKLRVFCDHVSKSSASGDNWELSLIKGRFIVGPGATIESEPVEQSAVAS
jgi:hypothetical protein